MRTLGLIGSGVTAGLAAIFAGAWHLELWLVVVTMAAGAGTLAVHDRIHEGLLARRVATWALHVPSGATHASELEQTIAADLATMALGDVRTLDDAVRRVHAAVDDPWDCELARERLHRAMQYSRDRGAAPPGTLVSALASPVTRLTGLVAAIVLTLAAAIARTPLLLAPVAAAMAVVGMGQGEATRRKRLPLELCHGAAVRPVPQGAFSIFEPAVTAALMSLADSRHRVLRRARALVGCEVAPGQQLALDRLARADRDASASQRPTPSEAVCWWLLATAAAFAVMAVL